MKNTKYKKELPTLDLEKVLSIDEAVETLLNQPKRKFTESVDIAVSLGIDPKKSDQNGRNERFSQSAPLLSGGTSPRGVE